MEEQRTTTPEGPNHPPELALDSALTNALRYLLKEYRIEQSEHLFRQLATLPSPPPQTQTKFWFRFKPGLPELGSAGAGPLLETLAKILGNPVVAPFGSRAPVMPAGEGELESLGRLLVFYLEETRTLLAYRTHSQRRGTEAEVLVVRPSPLYPYGVLETVVVGAESLGVELLKFYEGQPLPTALLLRLRRRRSLQQLAEAQALAIPPRLRAGVPADFLTFGDGSTLEWGPDGSTRGLLLRGLGELVTLATQRGDTHVLWGRYATPYGWYQLLFRLRRGQHLAQLRRFFHDPSLGRVDNQVRLLSFLGWLGRVIRSPRRGDCGLLLYGGPHSGKTTFLRSLARCIWGPEEVATVGLGRQFNPQRIAGAAVLLVEDVTPRELRASRIAKWVAPAEIALDRKHRSPLEVALHQKLFLMSSDRSPVELFGAELAPLTKRFGEGYQLFGAPHHPVTNPTGYIPEMLWGVPGADGETKVLYGELMELVPLALIFSGVEMEELVAAEMETIAGGGSGRTWVGQLLRHPPLEVLERRPGLLLEDLDSEQSTAMETALDWGHHYPLLPILGVVTPPTPALLPPSPTIAPSLSQDQWEQAVYGGDSGWGEVGGGESIHAAPPTPHRVETAETATGRAPHPALAQPPATAPTPAFDRYPG